ncbi:uncharacterized protein ACA1_102890 [Acanthamoeba castellanii str. Neff]|uniref:Uncharacterized protein n=1 Tax=Acanthamoeba castellanii (strain ATCC 30010 / Neff) TaxID=1257118 RepID=L8GE04_ACACF|nr:uncharacterized protein ACA1_102890 [Acanthamoeba castellanii str. Neff]ELR10953.1 hypothetical protein ACA1_102890 [Acanthamoeba castellanii str. Neff]
MAGLAHAMESQLSQANEEGIRRDPTKSEHWHREEDKPAGEGGRPRAQGRRTLPRGRRSN